MDKIFSNMIEDLTGKDINLNLDFYKDKQIKNFKQTSWNWQIDDILDIRKKDNIYIVDYYDKSIGVSVIN